MSTKKSKVGAPSQHNQTSRKGKRTWRKNVDIDDVEEGLENLRSEERATGSTLQSKQNEDLFQVDLKGDDQIRKSLPRLPTTQLTSFKIISQRSAVPAVVSRTTRKNRTSLTREEKSRLLRIGKRTRKGPFNSAVDPTQFGSGSALLELSEAVKKSGQYDPWAVGSSVKEEEVTRDGFLPVQPNVKAPSHPNLRDIIDVPPIPQPHVGTSYNPPVDAYQELILKAHEAEEQKLKESTKVAAIKESIDQLWVADKEGITSGMLVDPVQSETGDEEEGTEDGYRARIRMPERKTKQQRRKAEKLLAEKRALAEKAAKRRMLTKLDSVQSLRRAATRLIASSDQTRAARRLMMREKAKRGLAGQRIGKHKVPVGEIDVQLGEELSESLRELKPEGNLFRDRFLSLQQRALVEPRAPILSKRRSSRRKDYEKHAWKRFR